MNVLTLNAGSSSLKAGVYHVLNDELITLGKAELTGIGTTHVRCRIKGTLIHSHDIQSSNFKSDSDSVTVNTLYQPFIDDLFEQFNLQESKLIVSHRVVHGGTVFSSAVAVDRRVLKSLTDLIHLAPLHQPYNLKLIEEMMKRYPQTLNIACFDTMFHSTQSELHTSFALPKMYREKGIRRYGFHGLSYAYLSETLRLKQRTKERTVALHLGAGSSACAMIGGQSIATSMGFSAVEGIPMGTRTGQLDPGVILHLLRNGMTPDQIEHLIYKESGWLGLSGISSDMITLLASSDPQAGFTVDYYCEHIAQEIARLTTTIEGLDRLIFTAGIGEHSPVIRQKVVDHLNWLGATLDTDANEQQSQCISDEDSRILINVQPTDEEAMLAQYAKTFVR